MAILPDANNELTSDEGNLLEHSLEGVVELDPQLEPLSRDFAWIEGVFDLETRTVREANSLGYNVGPLTQVYLPYHDPGRRGLPVWVRRNGDLTMTLRPGVTVNDEGRVVLEYPYGKYPRLILPWLTTQVVLRQKEIESDGTIVIPIADSLRSFMQDIGLGWGGKQGKIVRDQTRRLLSASISLSQRLQAPGGEVRERLRQMVVAESYDLWWGDRDEGDAKTPPLWENEVRLSAPFVQSILAAPVPTDLRALKLLSDKGGPMAMDIYSWLSYRLFSAKKASLIPWELLAAQFGNQTKETWKFRQQFTAKLKIVKIVYRFARFSVQDKGLLIFPSPSPLKEDSRGRIES